MCVHMHYNKFMDNVSKTQRVDEVLKTFKIRDIDWEVERRLLPGSNAAISA